MVLDGVGDMHYRHGGDVLVERLTPGQICTAEVGMSALLIQLYPGRERRAGSNIMLGRSVLQEELQEAQQESLVMSRV